MGLLSWLFPGPVEKVAKARRLMADGRFAEARMLVVDVEGEAAEALRLEAEAGLVRLNLEGAVKGGRAGDGGAPSPAPVPPPQDSGGRNGTFVGLRPKTSTRSGFCDRAPQGELMVKTVRQRS